MFKGKYKKLRIPVARKFVKEVLSLPCYPFMKKQDIKYVIGLIKEYMKNNLCFNF